MRRITIINTLLASVVLSSASYAMAGADFERTNKVQHIDVRQVQLSAENGNQQAQYRLALMLEHGQDLIADQTKAAALYLQAAKQGHVAAQYSIGIMYLEGKGLAKDRVKAWTWLALAADNGFENVYLMRDKVAMKMSHHDLQAAKSALIDLKNTLPQPHPASLMILAVAGK